MKTSFLLFFYFLFVDLYAEVIVFNPRNADTSFSIGTKLPKDAERKWLQSVYSKVDLTLPLDAAQIKDETGETLKAKIQKVSEAYLQLNIEEADALATEAYDLLAKTLPYLKMKEDLILLAGLKAMIAERMAEQEKKDKISVPAEALPFYSDKSFQARVPMKVFDRLSEGENKSMALDSKTFLSPKISRLYLSGKEIQLPSRISKGKYLAHWLEEDKLTIGWLHMGLDSEGIKIERLRERNLWTALPVKNLRAAFEAGRPAKYSRSALGVLAENNSGEFSTIMITGSGKSEAASASIIKEQKNLLTPNLFNVEENWKEIDDNPSIFKNPWFWVGVGLVAGAAGGFAIYEGTKGHQTVTTP